jgi:hypothetical protein
MFARYLGKQSCGIAAGGLSVGLVGPAENSPVCFKLVCLHTAGMGSTSRNIIGLGFFKRRVGDCFKEGG